MCQTATEQTKQLEQEFSKGDANQHRLQGNLYSILTSSKGVHPHDIQQQDSRFTTNFRNSRNPKKMWKFEGNQNLWCSSEVFVRELP
jgi:hypothetical protein